MDDLKRYGMNTQVTNYNDSNRVVHLRLCVFSNSSRVFCVMVSCRRCGPPYPAKEVCKDAPDLSQLRFCSLLW